MPLHKQPHAEPPPSLTHAFPHEMEREEEEAPSRSSHNVMNMLLHPLNTQNPLTHNTCSYKSRREEQGVAVSAGEMNEIRR